jgi:hypothetical protein
MIAAAVLIEARCAAVTVAEMVTAAEAAVLLGRRFATK